MLARGATDLPAEVLRERFERELVTTTHDGIRVQPLYTGADRTEAGGAIGYPGLPPFVRGGTPLGGCVAGWEIRQPVDVTAGGSGTEALDALTGGAGSLLLRRAVGHREGPVLDVDLLDSVLDGVYLDLVSIVLDPGLDPGCGGGPARALVDLWTRRGIGPGGARGVLGLDPMRAHAHDAPGDPARWTRVVTELASTCARDHPGVRSVVVDATPYHQGGGSDVDELGCAIATGVAHLRLLTGAGLGLEAALGQLEFRFAASADQFLTITKLRGARRLWAQVAEALGVERAGAQRQHAVTSRTMLTRYDPWVNLLRNTVACASAGMGGADAVTVEPHDLLVEPTGPTEMGRRLARTTQVILIEESHLARVIDPAGGSWYLESLADSVAHEAWRWFQAIEAAGGMGAAIDCGLVHERIEATWQRRRRALALGVDTITGVSAFPNLDETIPAPGEPPAVEPRGLRVHRYAEEFETLRSRTDEETRRRGDRPAVLLVCLGSPRDHTAAATEARSLFETAGLRVVVHDAGDDPDRLLGVVAATGARLVCLCSSEAGYAEQGPAILGALGRSGAVRRYVVARPGDATRVLDAAGVDEYVHAGCDVLDVLNRALAALGID